MNKRMVEWSDIRGSEEKSGFVHDSEEDEIASPVMHSYASLPAAPDSSQSFCLYGFAYSGQFM